MAVANHAPGPGTLLGRGIYDVVEVARILGRDPETITRWTRGPKALHRPSDPRILSFLDLVSLHAISNLVKRRVPKGEIRSGGDYVADQLDTTYPYAHHGLATVGAAVFLDGPDPVDVGKGGQGAFRSMVEEFMEPVVYGSDSLAVLWRPYGGVWINPDVQAGTPCIDGTRVPTRTIAELVGADDDPADIADDYRLDVAQVKAAIEYERAA